MTTRIQILWLFVESTARRLRTYEYSIKNLTCEEFLSNAQKIMEIHHHKNWGLNCIQVKRKGTYQ